MRKPGPVPFRRISEAPEKGRESPTDVPEEPSDLENTERKMETYTPEQVSKHNSSGDLWMALHGKVYDMSAFLKEHPGGEEVLLELAGKDGSKCFDDIGHSQEAILLKDGYQIGVLEGEFTETEPARQPTIDDDDWEYVEPKKERSEISSYLIALAFVIYAALFYYMFL